MKHLTILVLLFFFSCSEKENLFQDDDPIDIESGNTMKIGVLLNIHTPLSDKYHDDFIHPCVRYIPKGFAGHKWWLIVTPYYKNDNKLENPMLFYGDSNTDETPPRDWTFVKLLEDTPADGYNSDPCLYFDGNKLWAFWRENYTKACSENRCTRVTVGIYTLDAKIFSEKRVYAKETSTTSDSEMCPIIINYKGNLKLYGSYYEFKPNRKNLGMAIWKLNGDLDNGSFSIEKLITPLKTNIDFWHFDIFEYKGSHYCVYTSEAASQIILGKSEDGVNFRFYKTPLLSDRVSGKRYFYKPSAMVLNGEFYLWHPCLEPSSIKTSKLWMSHAPFDRLIEALESRGFVE
ncbi:hypothetical protein FACS1894179_10180 [Bacteroidia bacterium]|nr:hypothetical protein FACS1894179_10180 [Bacteroidia bacterium]